MSSLKGALHQIPMKRGQMRPQFVIGHADRHQSGGPIMRRRKVLEIGNGKVQLRFRFRMLIDPNQN